MVFCRKCGSLIPTNSKLCTQCERLKREALEAATLVVKKEEEQ